MSDLVARCVTAEDKFVVFCAACERRAEVVADLGYRADFSARWLHVRCHGVARVVRVSVVTEHVSKFRGGPVAVLWEAVDDVVPEDKLDEYLTWYRERLGEDARVLDALDDVARSREWSPTGPAECVPLTVANLERAAAEISERCPDMHVEPPRVRPYSVTVEPSTPRILAENKPAAAVKLVRGPQVYCQNDEDL